MPDAVTQHAPPADGDAILIVEDEGLVAMFIEDALADLGYACCGVADTADAALALAEAHRPRLALVDIGLRGRRDGIALAGDLTGRLGIAVLFLTGENDPETLGRAAAAGPRGFLAKPFTEPEIADALKAALEI